MNTWFEVISGTVVNLGWMWVGSRYGFLWSRTGKKKEEDDGRLPHNAAWRTSAGSRRDDLDTFSYRCPKCRTDHIEFTTNSKLHFVKYTPKFCECLEHPKAHFHFECGTCGFKCLTKTGDET